MSKRRKRQTGVVPLPWEARNAWLSNVFSLHRFRPLLAAVVLVMMVMGAYDIAEDRSKVRATRAAIGEVRRAMAAFRAEMDRCPRSTVELVHPPKAGAQYLSELPKDGWDRDLLVRCPGSIDPEEADVVSAGRSGSFAVDDNIF